MAKEEFSRTQACATKTLYAVMQGRMRTKTVSLLSKQRSQVATNKPSPSISREISFPAPYTPLLSTATPKIYPPAQRFSFILSLVRHAMPVSFSPLGAYLRPDPLFICFLQEDSIHCFFSPSKICIEKSEISQNSQISHVISFSSPLSACLFFCLSCSKNRQVIKKCMRQLRFLRHFMSTVLGQEKF